jgi:hypothetical protein
MKPGALQFLSADAVPVEVGCVVAAGVGSKPEWPCARQMPSQSSSWTRTPSIRGVRLTRGVLNLSTSVEWHWLAAVAAMPTIGGDSHDQSTSD